MAKNTMSPLDLLNKVRNSANLGTNATEKSIAVKLNKAGKLKFQLLAPNEEFLFRARTQHAISTLPDNEDANVKMIVVDCQGKDCPVCLAAQQFKNSGVTTDMLNEAYKPKFPYTKVRNFLTGSEHFLVGVKILADNADEGTYLPKDEELGSTQLLQLSKAAFNSLMSAYEDFIEDNEDDMEDLPPLFGIVEDSEGTVDSLTVSVRVATQPWSYNFSFGKAAKTEKSDINMDKLKLIEDAPKPSEDYLQKAVDRIKELQNWFTGVSNIMASTAKSETKSADKLDKIVDDDDVSLDDLL